jgi:hypothetical protein
MDNRGAIIGPLLGIVLVAIAGVRGAILLSVIPGLLAAGAISTRFARPRSPSAASISRSDYKSGRCCTAACAF